MDYPRYLSLLSDDVARLLAVGAGRQADPVPSCPGWDVADLACHLAEVFRHKVGCIELRHPPQPWPPDRPDGDMLGELRSAYRELSAAFAAGQPSDTAWTWYEPDQTVGFWIRRMALEAVVHRVDGELAAGTVSAVPADLALDGIDEVLTLFLDYGLRRYADDPDVAAVLSRADGRPLRVRAADRSWLVRPTPQGIDVTAEPSSDAPMVSTLSGDPAAVFLRLWNRGGEDGTVIGGDPGPVHYLAAVMREAGA